MAYQLSLGDVQVLELLLDSGQYELETLDAIARRSSDSGANFLDIAVREFGLDEDGLYVFLAEASGYNLICSANIDLASDCMSRASLHWMRMYSFVPVSYKNGVLYLATPNFLDDEYKVDVQELLSCECRFAAVGHTDLKLFLESKSLEEVLSAVVEGGPLLETQGEHVSELIDTILETGIFRGASDIHIEPDEEDLRVRYRIEGTFVEMDPIAISLLTNVVVRIKALANLNVAESRVPQDGRIDYDYRGKKVDMRVSTLPVEHGEMLCIRVLDRSRVKLDINSISLPPSVVDEIVSTISAPNGIFLVTGPTGSGKTTSLYACLHEMNKPEVKILTAEDPVEYDLDGIVQVQVIDGIGLSYAKVLRSFLRQDPDVIMLGEIRDTETANIAVQAALTGHFVLSTLHTNDAVSAVTRLLDLGVEQYLIASSLVAVMAQRLVRANCPHCRETYIPSEDAKACFSHDDLEGLSFQRGVGCEECAGTGYLGRLPIVEFFKISASIKLLLAKNVDVLALKDQALSEGMITLKDQALALISSGDATLEEISVWIQRRT